MPPPIAPLITIVGNLGVGKTTLAQQLCAAKPDWRPFWETPEKRPFQIGLANQPSRWATTNQIDFLTYRAQQERQARHHTAPTIFDGGLDQDYFVFTRYLHHLQYLTNEEYDLCTRTYKLLRQLLPPPDLIIYLITPTTATLQQRRANRDRINDIAITPDSRLPLFTTYLEDWLNNCQIPIYPIPPTTTSTFDPHLTPLIEYLNKRFPPT